MKGVSIFQTPYNFSVFAEIKWCASEQIFNYDALDKALTFHHC